MFPRSSWHNFPGLRSYPQCCLHIVAYALRMWRMGFARVCEEYIYIHNGICMFTMTKGYVED